MQKVIRRTILAEKQAARRLRKRKDIQKRERQKTDREQNAFVRSEVTQNLKSRRFERREDWELGPLAPRRDVGNKKDTFGAVSTQQLRRPTLTFEERKEKLKDLGGFRLNLVKGDRVVILEGRDKGKIGKITATDTSRAECTVQGLNMVDIEVPQYMISETDTDRRPVRTIEKPVPLDKVRLVFPLTDPETGVTRDVIVKKLVSGRLWVDKVTGKRKWARIIPGLDIAVPWPKVEPKEHKDCAVDTLRAEVETRTFVPTLFRPPFPSTVIDELRNKYSIFRTRHDPEYIAAKMKEDELKEEKKKLAEEMRTPLKEINRKLRKMRKAKGKGELTVDMLEKLGQIIATKRQVALDAAGMEKVEQVPETIAA